MRSIDLPPSAALSAAPASPPAPRPVYAGLVTRGIAFVIDAAVILVVELIVWVSGVVIVGVLHLPHAINAILVVLGGCLAILWSAGYFVAFWSTTGQTPGSRVMQIRVVASDGDALRPRRAVIRCLGLLLAALPLFAGFVPILFDGRRRGFQDWLARTVVIVAPQLSIAGIRRASVRRAPRPAAPPR